MIKSELSTQSIYCPKYHQDTVFKINKDNNNFIKYDINSVNTITLLLYGLFDFLNWTTYNRI